MAQFYGKNLTCVRGERQVFTGLDYILENSDALVLLGPNGSGKSSLLRLMAGLLIPNHGQLAWAEKPILNDRDGHSAQLHYVGHLDAVKPVFSVFENVQFWADLRPTKEGFDAEKALLAFSIGHLRDIPGRYLSAGQKRRVNLSRLLAAHAPLWLLDEPTTALDVQTVDQLTNIIAKHRSDGGIVVVSTHTPMDLPGAKILDLSNFTGGYIG